MMKLRPRLRFLAPSVPPDTQERTSRRAWRTLWRRYSIRRFVAPPEEPVARSALPMSDLVSTPLASSSETENRARELAYQSELLRLFEQRLHLLSSMALLLLPLFALLHALWSPETRREVALTHLFLVGVCVLLRIFSVRINDLRLMRALALGSYALFALGAAMVGAQVSQPHLDAPISNSFVVYSAFNQIVLSLLVLPFGLCEATAVAVIVMLAMASASLLQWKMTAAQATMMQVEPFFWSHLFVLGATSFVVLCLAHLNGLQRRAAFEAAWKLAQLSKTDAVTGGWNRHHLEQTLRDEIARAARFERALSVLMFDLDDFKRVNDTHGHQLGDEVLREVHAAALQTVREIDIVTRFGGDEFLIILPETDADSAHAIAQRLQQNAHAALIARWGEKHSAARVTLSVGLWTQSQNAATPSAEVLSRVDAKLYEAKRAGKNRIAR